MACPPGHSIAFLHGSPDRSLSGALIGFAGIALGVLAFLWPVLTLVLLPKSMFSGDLGKLLKAQTPVGPFPAPVFVAQGLTDPLVRPSLQQQWIDDRCDAGVAIDYRTFAGLSHVSLVAADSPLTPQIVQWTLGRWNREATPTECTSKEYPKQSKG